MSIKIKKDLCVSCGGCLSVCPGNLIYKDESSKAYIKYQKDCWGCTACVKECPVDAILYYIGAEIGGKGGTLSAKTSKDKIKWSIEDFKGEIKTIEVDRSESNRY